MDQSIETNQVCEEGLVESKVFDISKVDFNRLRKEFEKSSTKRTTVQSLKHVIENRLNQMLMRNPLRTDFHDHYQQLVNSYNREKDRLTIEQTFEALMKFSDDLSTEESRAMRENLKDEETLALFDLLLKPDLDKKGIKQLKTVALTLLKTLKAERLKVENWREKESTRDAVKQQIYDFLFDEKTGLPVENYDEPDIKTITDRVFGHVYRVYPTIPSPVYSSTSWV